MVDPLVNSLQRQTDLELVRDGTPSLLLMLDGFLLENPGNKKLLMAGTQGYVSYASTLDELGERKRALLMSEKAKKYGLELLCTNPVFEKNIPAPFTSFSKCIDSFQKKDVDALFWAGFGWATWIRYQNGSPASIADLPKVEKIMLKVLELDENYHYGAAHIVLGHYYGSRPKLLGGRPELSRQHFEKALAISDRQFLLAQVSYAESYARIAFDRELFLKLLTEVVNHSSNEINALTSSNELAKRKARKLINNVDGYF